MTTPDPFNTHGSPNHHPDGFQAPGPAQPYGTPADGAPPQYPAPGYGAYQAPPPPQMTPPYDGISIAALVSGLLGTGPVAAILGGIGLSRTARNVRSGRWMAWTGLILGVLSTIAWIALIVFFVWLIDTTETYSGEPEVGIFDTSATYGDDPYLDGLWDACEAGDMAACDELYTQSPFGSAYEDFAWECGGHGRPLAQLQCVG